MEKLKIKMKIFENKDEDHPYDDFIKTKIDFSIFNGEEKIYDGSVESSYGYEYEIEEDYEIEEEKILELNDPSINYMGLIHKKNLLIVLRDKKQEPDIQSVIRKMKYYNSFNIEAVLKTFEDFIIFSHYSWEIKKQNPNWGFYSLSEEETEMIKKELNKKK